MGRGKLAWNCPRCGSATRRRSVPRPRTAKSHHGASSPSVVKTVEEGSKAAHVRWTNQLSTAVRRARRLRKSANATHKDALLVVAVIGFHIHRTDTSEKKRRQLQNSRLS